MNTEDSANGQALNAERSAPPSPTPVRLASRRQPAATGRAFDPLVGLCLLAAGLFLHGCTSPAYRMPPPTEPPAPRGANVLNEGDTIQIIFPGATNLNSYLKIPMDGTIRLSFAGEFRAAGKTPQELQADILNVYGPQLQLKEVNVALISSSATVYVSGAVLRPGKVALDRPMTVLEAITECGGLDTANARPSRVIVIRQESGKQVSYPINMQRVLEGKEPTPFYLKPSDVIHVPKKVFNL